MATQNGSYSLTIDLGLVDFHELNYNVHDADQLAGLQDSLGEFGYMRRAVVQEGEGGRYTCLAGEGIITAARLEGYRELELTVVPRGYDQAKARAYLVADNEHARKAHPDPARLANLFEIALEDDETGALAAATGIDEETYTELVKKAQGADSEAPSASEELEAKLAELEAQKATLMDKWQVEPGQVWQAQGETLTHYLACGDSTDPETWAGLFATANIRRVAGVMTSPPYAEQRKARYGGIPEAEYVDWWARKVAPLVYSHLEPDGSFFVNIKAHTTEGARSTYDKELVLRMVRDGWIYFEEFAWVKPGQPGRFDRRFRNAFEPVHHFTRETRPRANIEEVFESREARVRANMPALAKAQGVGVYADKTVDTVRPSNVLNISFDATGVEGDDHSARYPVKLPAFFVRAYSYPGDAWLDPFSGTGTTIVACHRYGRQGLGIELTPSSVAVTLERLEQEGLEVFHG